MTQSFEMGNSLVYIEMLKLFVQVDLLYAFDGKIHFAFLILGLQTLEVCLNVEISISKYFD